jgi:uncharacterized protein with ATP-grasp and redox domains
MKTAAECFPCFVRQSLQVALVCGCSPEVQIQTVRRIAFVVSGLDPALSPPANAKQVYRALAEVTGCEDPYLPAKKASNEQALKVVAALRREIAGSADELMMSIRFAIAGNIIDFGAYQTFDIDKALDNSRTQVPAVDHSKRLMERIETLERASHILYLADNCGEIVYDSLLVEYLARRGFALTVAVKDGPIINDALLEDALAAGLDRYARVISNGSRCPGTVLADCSPEFRQEFASADLVIAKGQGNFESLSEADREIFFLLTVKCPVAARHLAELAAVDPASLPGKGEMAVFHFAKNSCNGGSNEDTH